MEPSLELTAMATQLEGLITANWEALPAQAGLDLQLLAEKLHKLAEQTAGTQPTVIITNGPATVSEKLAGLERSLAELASHTRTLLPQDAALELRMHALRIGNLVHPVQEMEDRLRPPSRREAEAMGGNVLALRRPATPGRNMHGGTAA